MINIEVKENIKLEDGKHKGEIIKIENKHVTMKGDQDDFDILEFSISAHTDKGDTPIRFGCSPYISSTSKLGQLLKRFGYALDPGTQINVESLIGLDCEFLTMTKIKGDKTYANIIVDSVKKLEREEQIGAVTN